MTPLNTPGTPLEDAQIISILQGNLVNYRTDIAERNTYIDQRDRYLYGDGLYEELDLPDGFDSTMYNYLPRIVDINTAQLMGEPFGIYSHYIKQDISSLDPQQEKQQIDQITLQNKISETKAMGRRQAALGIIRDNGGFRIFDEGARTGSAYGSTLFQMWFDKDEKKIKIVNLESIQNWFPVWADNNFRERIGDAYVMQIALETANSKYGKFLPTDAPTWPVSYAGDPLINIQGASSTLTNTPGETVSSASTRRPMVTVINYTGILPGVTYSKKGEFIACKPGDETKISVKIVGHIIVEKITKEKFMPSFYYIPNWRVPRRPYGESDLVKSALDINSAIVQLKSDQHTLANKELFPMIMAKGFENGSIPKKKQREMVVIPMSADQTLAPVVLPIQALSAYESIIQDRLRDLLAVVAVPQALFFSPDGATGGSNQAAMTGMRPILDRVDGKHKLWEPVIADMFRDALQLASQFDKNVKALIEDEEDFHFYLRWPSGMRKEDPAHQAMLINDLHAGVKSVESYMEERGYFDPDQEMARIESNLEDKYKAAILGGRLSELAQFTIFSKLGVPLSGFNLPKISLKGDLTPQQEGNMADSYGWQNGPYGDSIGPQGAGGSKADENVINSGFIQYPAGPNGTPGVDPYAKYGTPNGDPQGQIIQGSSPIPQPDTVQPSQPPQAQPNATVPAGAASQPFAAAPGTQAPGGQVGPQAPIVTPGQNQPGTAPMSMPGSGQATSASPQGQVAAHNQHKGK